MNPALFYRRRDKTILPADLLATYLTYHANKAEDMKLLFQIRLIEREEKLSLREIKWRKHQLEEELKEQAEYYFGCHRVFSDQSLVSTSDSFKKNIYQGPNPTKALIPNGRLKELREKLRSMPIGNKSPQALDRAKLVLRKRQRFPWPRAESDHDIPADSTGVTEPTETLVGQVSKTDTIEQPPASAPIKSPDQKPEIIDEMHDSLHKVQKLKFKRIQSAPIPKHSREKAAGLDLEGRPYEKQKAAKVKVRRAKTCVTRRERLKTSFPFEKEPYSVEEKMTPSKQKEEMSEFTKERTRSDRSKKKIGKHPRPKSSPSIGSLSKHLDTRTQGPRARSAVTSRQRQKEREKEKEEKSSTIGSKMSLKALDTKSSSLSGDEKISYQEVEVAEEDRRTVILRKRPVARLDFSKAHRLVCKSFADSEVAKTGPVDEETIVRRYLEETSQPEEKITAMNKQGKGKTGSRDVEVELKGQQKGMQKTRLEIKLTKEEFPNEDTVITHSKMLIAEKRHTERRESVSQKDAKKHSIKRWIDAVDHVTDHVDKNSECKRFLAHQTKKHTKKHKLSVFKTRNYSEELKGKQSEVESDMRKKVLEYMMVYKKEEEEKNAEGEHQENDSCITGAPDL